MPNSPAWRATIVAHVPLDCLGLRSGQESGGYLHVPTSPSFPPDTSGAHVAIPSKSSCPGVRLTTAPHTPTSASAPRDLHSRNASRTACTRSHLLHSLYSLRGSAKREESVYCRLEATAVDEVVHRSRSKPSGLVAWWLRLVTSVHFHLATLREDGVGAELVRRDDG